MTVDDNRHRERRLIFNGLTVGKRALRIDAKRVFGSSGDAVLAEKFLNGLGMGLKRLDCAVADEGHVLRWGRCGDRREVFRESVRRRTGAERKEKAQRKHARRREG
ncbi:MAG TPA: hypothetical protein VE591_09245 [Candidatus Acidoferrum sp.]|nr:hypothetical protein [Candidatus Acidoferrum sp.]